MAGKKQFDESTALVCATEQFRRGGYANTSINDLAKATGLSRSSLYATFGSKEKFFLRVLETYCPQMMARLIPDNELPPTLALRRYLAETLDALEGFGDAGGCLVTNTLGEAGNIPAAVQESVTLALEQQVDQIETFLIEARRRGNLPAAANVNHLANYFVALRQSLGLMWRSGTPRRQLDEIIEISLDVLAPGQGRTSAVADNRNANKRHR